MSPKAACPTAPGTSYEHLLNPDKGQVTDIK